MDEPQGVQPSGPPINPFNPSHPVPAVKSDHALLHEKLLALAQTNHLVLQIMAAKLYTDGAPEDPKAKTVYEMFDSFAEVTKQINQLITGA